MNKLKVLSVVGLLSILLTGCGTSGTSMEEKHISDLSIAFVPSAPADEIMTATAPLEGLIQDEMSKMGWTIDSVDIEVGTNYEAVGESLASGTTDIGFVPGGTYVLYQEDGVEAILTATRFGLSKDFDDAKSWNDGQPTENTDEEVTYYRSLILSGPSDKGQELASIVNDGKELTFEDVQDANICLQSPSSSSGYLYPAYALNEAFGKSVTDLNSTVTTNGYSDALGRLASGQCDIAPVYADARMDYESDWTSTFGREASIWEETNVIGVTDGIMNDTISIAQDSDVYDEDFIADFQQAMINIGETEEGKDVISIYSHEGYQVATPSSYDVERQIQEEIIQ